mmetsp:Transcript_16710/g.42815  ORF Transcript_16710/g.42815 Transcript_16710/m.42815 type:complete len:234 (+) Transcript_16710:726-1427(+)
MPQVQVQNQNRLLPVSSPLPKSTTKNQRQTTLTNNQTNQPPRNRKQTNRQQHHHHQQQQQQLLKSRKWKKKKHKSSRHNKHGKHPRRRRDAQLHELLRHSTRTQARKTTGANSLRQTGESATRSQNSVKGTARNTSGWLKKWSRSRSHKNNNHHHCRSHAPKETFSAATHQTTQKRNAKLSRRKSTKMRNSSPICSIPRWRRRKRTCPMKRAAATGAKDAHPSLPSAPTRARR